MNKIKHLEVFILVFVVVSLVACKQTSHKEKKVNKENNITQIDSFEYKLKNEPKLFLEFWNGMSAEDFEKVANILTKQGVLKYNKDAHNYSYLMGKADLTLKMFSFRNDYLSSFTFEPGSESLFRAEKIDGIVLSSFDETSYEIFRLKYDLPPISYKPCKIFNLIRNINYKGVQEDNNELFIKTLTLGDINKIKENNKNPHGIIFSDVISYNRINLENEIIRNTDNKVLIFRDLMSNTSLITDASMPEYMNEAGNEVNNTKDKFIIEAKIDYSQIGVIYCDKNKYNRIKNREKIKDSISNSQKEKQKLDMQKRAKDYKNEI
jgi:hypothetical protein